MTGAHFGAPGSAVPSSPPGAPPAAGDAGSNYLSGLLNISMDADAGKQLDTGGDKLKQLASEGEFAVNEAGFQAYKKAIDEFIHGLQGWIRQLDVLAQRPRMGGGDYASKAADFNVTVYGGDPQSLLPNLILMVKGLTKASDALDLARRNYRETEEVHTVSFTQMSKKIAH